MDELGKVLIGVGLSALVAGALLLLLGWAGFRGLPGDVDAEVGGVRVVFPVVSCLVVSVGLTLLLGVMAWLRR